MEALERAHHVRARLELAVAIDVADAALLELIANTLGIPILDPEADVPDRGRGAVALRRVGDGERDRRIAAGPTAPARGARGWIRR